MQPKKKKNGVFFLSALGTDMKRYKKKQKNMAQIVESRD